jgi:hypothetical protein
MEVVGLVEVTYKTWNTSNHVDFSAKMTRPQFGLSCTGVGIDEHAIFGVIPPGVLPVRMHILSKFILWRLTPKIHMLLEMMDVAILWAICKLCC